MKGGIWARNRFLIKPFLVMLVVYLVGISALVLAGVHYADDVARTNYGYAGWAEKKFLKKSGRGGSYD